MSNNKKIKLKLINIYGCRCMLTGISVQKDSDLSYHHIIKKEHGGRTNIENGATLLIEIHQWLHNNIESKNKERFYLINECLKLYKKCLDLNKIELIKEYEEEIMPLFRKELSETRDDKERKRMNAYVKKLAKEIKNEKKQFDCNVYLLIRNSCKRCKYQRICEESDLIEEDYQSRQDKKLSNVGIQEWEPDIPKKEYESYKKEIRYQLIGLPKIKDLRNIEVSINFKCKNKIVGDLDNITKPILDILQKYEYIKNDKQIIKLNLSKEFGFKDNLIEIEIKEVNNEVYHDKS